VHSTDNHGSKGQGVNTATITNGMNASFELGQPSGTAWTTRTAATATQAGMNQPFDVAVDPAGSRLFVTPLIWDHVNPYGRFELDMNARLPLE
jgi:hypothetical protein